MVFGFFFGFRGDSCFKFSGFSTCSAVLNVVFEFNKNSYLVSGFLDEIEKAAA